MNRNKPKRKAQVITKQAKINARRSLKPTINKINLDIDEIKKLVKEVYIKYNNQFLCNFLRIFIYPLETDNQPDLNGVHAYGPYKNTIHFWINPNRKNWKKNFQETIFHEQSHAYLHTTNKDYVEHFIKEGPLYEWIISEGLAENYAESVTGGYNFKQGNKWFGFSKESALDQFKLIKNRIYGGYGPLYQFYA